MTSIATAESFKPLKALFAGTIEPASWRSSLLVVAVCIAYLWPLANQGWIPHDQGILAQSAQRVLSGELPHRDFDELYTGGLSYLHALAFAIWGVKMSSIRTMFLLISIVFIWVLHRVLRRLMPPAIAESTLLASLTWGLTNYFEAMPSWYNLFCIVFGLAAMLRYIDTGRSHWLFWVGFWGGMSLLCKIVGLYYIAAMYLVLAVDVQLKAQPGANSKPLTRWWLLAITAAVGSVWLLLVILMTRRNADAMLVIQLILPSLATAWAACRLAYRSSAASDTTSIRRLILDWSIFTFGVLLPVALYLLPYVASNSLPALYHGLFVMPFTRLTEATYPFPSGWSLYLIVVFWICLGGTLLCHPQWDRFFALLGLIGGLVFLALPYWYSREWVLSITRMLVPAIAVLASWMLISHQHDESAVHRRQLFLTLTLAAFCSLSQFPFAAPIYFCFIATLYLVLLQQLLTQLKCLATAKSLSVVGLLLGLYYVSLHTFFDDPRAVAMDPPIQLLDVPRGGLLVSSRDQQTYELLVREIKAHCQPHETLLATPDCPEVYFLSERDNPTRTFLEFFDAATSEKNSMVGLLSQLDVQMLVINLEPRHSAKLSDETISELASQFEQSASIGHFRLYYDRK